MPGMPTVITPVITDAGLAAAITANGNGVQLSITHVVLSTDQFTPTGTSTISVRKEKATVASGYTTGTGSFRINVLFSSYSGAAYNATTIGFYAGDPDAGGILFGVYSHPSSVIVQRNSLDYLAQYGLTLSRVPAGSISVTVDPTAAQAFALIAAHETATHPHSQYMRRTGEAALTGDYTTTNGAWKGAFSLNLANAYINTDAANNTVIYNMDGDDYFAYYRNTNSFGLSIAGVNRLFVDQFGPGRNDDATTPNGIPRFSQLTPTTIDRSAVASVPLLLDRFDVIHKYRADRTLYPVGGEMLIGTQMVPGGIYKLYINSADAGSFSNNDIILRPNFSSYANQFQTNFVNTGDPFVTNTATGYRTGVASPNPSQNNSAFRFDTYNGDAGAELAAELTLFPNQTGYYKKVLAQSGDAAGVGVGVSLWLNTTTAWTVVGGLSRTNISSGGSAPYFVDVYVRRIA
jgi:hypothetical protein